MILLDGFVLCCRVFRAWTRFDSHAMCCNLGHGVAGSVITGLRRFRAGSKALARPSPSMPPKEGDNAAVSTMTLLRSPLLLPRPACSGSLYIIRRGVCMHGGRILVPGEVPGSELEQTLEAAPRPHGSRVDELYFSQIPFPNPFHSPTARVLSSCKKWFQLRLGFLHEPPSRNLLRTPKPYVYHSAIPAPLNEGEIAPKFWRPPP